MSPDADVLIVTSRLAPASISIVPPSRVMVPVVSAVSS